MIYRIVDWSENFETAKSRGYKTLTWIAVPVNLGGAFMSALHDEFEERAATMYGVWIGVLQLAATMPCRGLFRDSRGNPVPIRRMARVTMFDKEDIESVLTWAIREGWVESLNPESLPSPCEVPAESPVGSLPNLTLPNTSTPQPPKGGGGSAVADQEGPEAKADPDSETRNETEPPRDEHPEEPSDLERAMDEWDASRGGKMPPAKRPPDAATFRRWSKLGALPSEVADRTRRAAASAKYANPDRATPLTFHALLAPGTWAEVGNLPPPAPKPTEDRGRQALTAAELAWRSGDEAEALRLLTIAEQYGSTEDEARHMRQQIEEPFEAKRPEWAKGVEA